MQTKILLLVAGVVVASGSLASATTITQTQSFGPSNTDWGIPTPVALNFAGFSTSLGTLTGVSISETESSSGSLTNQNNSTASSGTISSKIGNSWDVYLPSALNGTLTVTGTSTSNTATDTLAANTSGPLHAVTGTSSATVTSIGSDNLSAYASAFTIGADDSGSVSVHATNGNGNATYTDSGAVSVSVTYTYTAAPPPPPPTTTPEPASLALLGTGLIGMACSVRRRRH